MGAEDVKAEKPSPEGLLYAMEQLGRTGRKSFIQGTAWWTQRQRPEPVWILPAY